MPNGLLWIIPGGFGPRGFLESLQEYIAPSRNWASTRAKMSVKFDYYLEEECQIIHAEVSIDVLNPFGGVTAGYLLLSGKMSALPSILQPFQKHDVIPGEYWKLKLNDQTTANSALDWNEGGYLGIFNPAFRIHPEAQENLRMFLLMSKRKYDPDGNTAFVGILLLPTGMNQEFRRVERFDSQVDIGG
ncbi:hypothetical protein BDZ45DRAFT_753660 [Acephala macrosclerotiorum]|nr:hypothetical protein BDZ45DRAFT_753660 [Acephala macrosclerotiorum]